jgi:hypothetical protein
VQVTTDVAPILLTTKSPTPPPTPLPSATLPAPSHHPWTEDLETGLATTSHTSNITTTYPRPQPVASLSYSPHKPSISARRTSDGTPVRGARARASRAWRRFRSKLHHMDPVKLAYLRTSFVFAISVLVTWTPSSINRVYTLRNPTQVSFALNVASAAVLPLQGVWNAVIYFTTSWKILRGEVRAVRRRLRGWCIGASGTGSGIAVRMSSFEGDEDRWDRRAGTVRVQKGTELDG